MLPNYDEFDIDNVKIYPVSILYPSLFGGYQSVLYFKTHSSLVHFLNLRSFM